MTSPTGAPSASTTTSAARAGLARPPDGLGQGQVDRHGDRPPGQRAGRDQREPLLHPALDERLGRAGPDEAAEQRRPEDVGQRDRRPAPGARAGTGRRAATIDDAAPDPRRRRRCRCARRPVTRQTTAETTRPPSSGRPGSRLKTPTSRLLTIERAARAGRRDRRPARATSATPKATAATSRARPAGPATRDPGLPARGRRRPLDLGDAAEHVQADPAHGQPVRQGDDGVAELVHQDRDVEQQRRSVSDDGVPPRPEARGRLRRPPRRTPR